MSNHSQRQIEVQRLPPLQKSQVSLETSKLSSNRNTCLVRWLVAFCLLQHPQHSPLALESIETLKSPHLALLSMTHPARDEPGRSIRDPMWYSNQPGKPTSASKGITRMYHPAKSIVAARRPITMMRPTHHLSLILHSR
jgi:hypothetical protein